MLKIEHLKKTYGDFTLDCTMRVEPGCITGLVGENGAGKSTTFKAILGLISADGGTAALFGRTPDQFTKEDRQKMGVVLADSGFSGYLSVRDVLPVLKAMYPGFDRTRFENLCRKFDIPMEKKIKEFSTGMRQKAALAIALSHRAELLVLDEPASGLDPVARDEILDRLYDFMQQESHSVFISSHIVSDLEKLCDYIVFIHAGKIVFAEEKDVLKEKYAIFRGSSAQLSALDCAAVVSRMEGEYGVSALVLRDTVPSGLPLDRAGIEDIMLYFSRGVK